MRNRHVVDAFLAIHIEKYLVVKNRLCVTRQESLIYIDHMAATCVLYHKEKFLNKTDNGSCGRKSQPSHLISYEKS